MLNKIMDTCLGNCVTCLSVRHSLFEDLNTEELTVLNLNRTKHSYVKGDFIYHEGEVLNGLICLNHGKVKLVTKGKIEEEFIVSLHKMVDFIGFDDLMSGEKSHSSAIALENVSVCVIQKEQFLKVIAQNTSLALKIIKHQSAKLIQNQERLLNIAQSNLESRMAFTLLELLDFYGLEPDGETLALSIKRRELAALSSMNTANAIRTLAKIKSKGFIDTRKKELIIKNEYGLRKLI